MNQILIYIIRLLHALLVAFIVITPILNNTQLLLLHSIIVPFIILHWLTNNNTCALSTMEVYLKGINETNREEDCFTCNIFDPVYDFRKNYKQFTALLYLVTLSLWLISVKKLMIHCDENNFISLYDLLTRNLY